MTAIIGTADHYAQFVRLVRVRIKELRIPYATVDQICGFPDRYTNMLLCGNKTMSIYSFFTLARALALLPAFQHDGEKLASLEKRSAWIKVRSNRKTDGAKHKAKHQRFSEDCWRKWGRSGAIKRSERTSRRAKAMRRVIARKAALARWSYRRAESKQASSLATGSGTGE